MLITALAIAMLTVCWQSLKAAIANPIEALKEENWAMTTTEKTPRVEDNILNSIETEAKLSINEKQTTINQRPCSRTI